MTFRFPFALPCFFRPVLVSIIAFFCFVSIAAGQAPDGFRLWSNASGEHQVRAKLIDRVDDCVTLQLSDGRTVALKVEQLSPADQAYVRGLAAPAGDFPPADPPADPPVDPPQPEDEAAHRAKIRELLMDLSRGRPEDRAATAAFMVDYPCEECASALAFRGLKADEAEVRLAALRTLLTFRDNVACAGALLVVMKKQTRSNNGQLVIVPGLAILLSSKAPLVEADTVRFISTAITDSQLTQVASMLFQMLDLKRTPKNIRPAGEFQQPGMGFQQPGGGFQQPGGGQQQPGFGQQPPGVEPPQQPAQPVEDQLPSVASLFDEESIARILLGLTKTRQYMSLFTFRRVVIEFLTELQTRPTVPVLIDALQRTRGEVRSDIVSHLQAVTNKKFGLDVKAWQEWWAGEGKTFTMPVAPVRGSIPTVSANQELASYYGLPLYAERTLFVLDASGSMHNGQRIEKAKRELIYAIAKLSPNVWFNIIVFNNGTDLWKRSLIQATPASKQSAALYIKRISPMGGTETGDALKEAFKFNVESIYLLSDGMPSGDPQQIIREVTQVNQNRMISIYTIGMGMVPNGMGEFFLKQLSALNHGVYVDK